MAAKVPSLTFRICKMLHVSSGPAATVPKKAEVGPILPVAALSEEGASCQVAAEAACAFSRGSWLPPKNKSSLCLRQLVWEKINLLPDIPTSQLLTVKKALGKKKKKKT